MAVILTKVNSGSDVEVVRGIMCTEVWPFHLRSKITSSQFDQMIAAGEYVSPTQESFIVYGDNDTAIGLIRLLDLDDVDDGTPMIDLRIASQHRLQGFGTVALSSLVAYAFGKWVNMERLGGTTRADNVCMRRVFVKNGFLKEGHFRADWRSERGCRYDTVFYGILRQDWTSGLITPLKWSDLSI